MGERIEIEVDQQGRLVLPSRLASQMGLTPGIRLVVEQDAANVALRVQSEQPRIVEKLGVLVVEPEVTTDIEEFVRNERERYAMESLHRVSQ